MNDPSVEDANRRADFASRMRPNWFPTRGPRLLERLEAARAPAWVIARVAKIDPCAKIRSPGHAWDLGGRK